MSRYCPQCDTQTDDATCASCGVKTYAVKPLRKEDDPTIGVILDERYRIDALLGQGGMGAVYRATHMAMDATVAVKMIRSDFASNAEAVKRFHREAFAASRLSHPHTIRVFDFGQAPNGDLYMAMEYLVGRSLSDANHDTGPLSVGRALKIASETAQSLAEAHANGFVHRDLKPDNIMLQDVVGKDDFVKVLDFGIAKLVHGDSGESNMTSTGAVIGTPYYMSPEQAQGLRGVTGAADVYALGVILYEMLTHTRPFEGDTPLAILMGHVNQAAPRLPEDLGIPHALRDLVEAMMRKLPEERPEIHALLAALDEIMGVVPGDKPAATGRASAVEAAITPVPTRLPTDDLDQKETIGATPAPGDSLTSEDVAFSAQTPSRAWILLLVGLLLLLAIGLGLAMRSGDKEPETPSTPTTSPAPSPTPDVSEAPADSSSEPGAIPVAVDAASSTPKADPDVADDASPAQPDARDASELKAASTPPHPDEQGAPKAKALAKPRRPRAGTRARTPATTTTPTPTPVITTEATKEPPLPATYERLDLAPLPSVAPATPKADPYERLDLP